MKQDKHINFSWLRGFADRGCQLHLASRSIFMTSNDQVLLRDIYSFLVLQKFHCRWSRMGDRFGIRISTQASLQKWRDHVGFSDPAKQAKLDELIGDTP